MAIQWEYDASKHVYRNKATGRKLTQRQVIGIRDKFIEGRQQIVRGLAEQLANGEITQPAFEAAFRAATAESFAAQQMFGAGGINNLATLSDPAKALQAMLDKQIPFADVFMQDIAAGKLSPDEIANRAALYQGSSIEAYEKSNAADAGIDSLPYWPGDWGTECKAGCRCSWLIDTVFDGNDEVTIVTWETEHDGAVCPDCEQRGNDNQQREVARVPRTDGVTVGAAA
jgi:hypothetical protein